MDIKNKLLLVETTDSYVFVADNEDHVIAEVLEAIPDVPEEAQRVKRMVECYNLFLGIENPTEYLKQLKSI
jgi:hypothetical protein